MPGAASQGPVVAVIVLPNDPLPTDVKTICNAHSWEPRRIAAIPTRLQSGRLVQLASRGDTDLLYRWMNRGWVAVVTRMPNVSIRLSPATSLRARDVVDLSTFCRHKAFVQGLNNADASSWPERFKHLTGTVGCEGFSDPRAMPLHMFSRDGDLDLDTEVGRKRFRQTYRHREGGLKDLDDVHWNPAENGARHAVRDPVTVAGFQLQAGSHWDVAPTLPRVISTPIVQWRVKGYCNVYPDGHILPGTRCHIEWSSKDSQNHDERDLRRAKSQ